MSGGSATGAGLAVGALLTVVGLVAVVVGLVAASLTLGAGGFAGVGPGVAVAAVLFGLTLLAVGGTLLFGLG